MTDTNSAISTIELQGEPREQALAEFRRQMALWNEAIPQTPEFFVLDFGLGEFATTGLIEYWIANEFDAGYCGKYLFLFDGQSCPHHSHQNKHETFYVLRGTVNMLCNGKERLLKPGDIFPMDVNLTHGFTGIGNALILEISKPCFVDDNRFEDTRIPIGPNYAS